MSSKSDEFFELKAAQFFKLNDQTPRSNQELTMMDNAKQLSHRAHSNMQYYNLGDQKTADTHQQTQSNHIIEQKRSKQMNSFRTNSQAESQNKYSNASYPCEPIVANLSTSSSDLTSASSLPSISSSPSLSPSLVCPHMSIDDLLKADQRGGVSPHAVGFCELCYKDSQKFIQSAMKDVHYQSVCSSTDPKLLIATSSQSFIKDNKQEKKYIQNTYSSYNTKEAMQQNLIDVGEIPLSSDYVHSSNGRKAVRKKSITEDSLDFYLNPIDDERAKLSPVLKKSVDFIRHNFCEAGRVLIIHENGEPFEKPLRIGITRDEFSNINQLLDYISTRCFVTGGARYLFHLDGQLVYSVNELKHGSVYIVSSTRTLNARATYILRNKYKNSRDLKPRLNFDRKPLTIPKYSSMEGNIDKPILDSRAHIVQPLRRSKSNLVISQTNRKVLNYPKNSTRSNSNLIEKKGKSEISNNSSKTKSEIQCAKQNILSTIDDHKYYKDKITQTELAPKITSQHLEAYSPRSSKIVSNKKYQRNTKINSQKESPQNQQRARARSDLTSSSLKKNQTQPKTGVKKSVTFIDIPTFDKKTKRVLSQNNRLKTALSNSVNNNDDIMMESMIDSEKIDEKTITALGTNDIGIQVSDSLEGLLIDLPTVSRTSQSLGGARGKPKKFITITEKQLSNEEMSVFKDLTRGDHVSSKNVKNNQNINESNTNHSHGNTRVNNTNDDDNSNWQYPKHDDSSEALINQNNADDKVCSRVVTPSPSINSSSIDNTSLTMSFDSFTIIPTQRKQSMMVQLDSIMERDSSRASDVVSQVVVQGKKHAGSKMPSRNMSLLWANGFFINETIRKQQPELSSKKLNNIKSSNQNSKASTSELFMPSYKYHNFIKHSAYTEELVYPIGSLVVLYSSWTDTQRFYSGHTTKVSSLFLIEKSIQGELINLGVSAQIENDSTGGCIHIWSLITLETIMVFTDQELKDKQVLAIHASFDNNENGHLAVLAKCDKRLWLFGAPIMLNAEPNDRIVTSMFKTNKLLQENQVPFCLIPIDLNKRKSNARLKETINLISYGKKHIQHWLIDEKAKNIKQAKLSINKNETLVQAMTNANCIAKISSSELIVGQSNGHLTLLSVQHEIENKNENTSKNNLSVTNKTYTINATDLDLFYSGKNQRISQDEGKQASAITCVKLINKQLFVTGDSAGIVKFWSLVNTHSEFGPSILDQDNEQDLSRSVNKYCTLLNSVAFPCELGAICSIMIADYQPKKFVVSFYLVATSNAIVLGSIQLSLRTSDVEDCPPMFRIIYEGHESAVMCLEADFTPVTQKITKLSISKNEDDPIIYFTCSLDCKVCKWNTRILVWESILPSACNSMAIHPNGFVLVVGSLDGTVYIIDKVSGLLISYFSLVPTSINSLVYSRDGSLLVAGCENGSIFMLPVQNRGLVYKKVSIFQSPSAVFNLQFSRDNRYILTSVDNNSNQDLILWDIPNFRYIQENVTNIADKIDWYDPTCTGTNDVKSTYDNVNIFDISSKINRINSLCCHQLRTKKFEKDQLGEGFVISGDTEGYVRLFSYPCNEPDQGFFEFRQTSNPINTGKFLSTSGNMEKIFVTTGADGSILIWKLIESD